MLRRMRCGRDRNIVCRINIRVRRMALGGNKNVIIKNNGINGSRRCICVRQGMDGMVRPLKGWIMVLIGQNMLMIGHISRNENGLSVQIKQNNSFDTLLVS
ncbi:hypothetical protein A2U01_0011043 [Trifolium medium]|uniref:Uncharacterized protein n=1 Tax=Trifolium medium TaxID=97028 RepID=A0A392MSY5_9FABA|nr:hypothetical protein [Trifolium medium]